VDAGEHDVAADLGCEGDRLGESGSIASHVADLDRGGGTRFGRDHRVGLGQRQSDRLFEEDMLAGADGGIDHVGVKGIGISHEDCIDGRIFDELPVIREEADACERRADRGKHRRADIAKRCHREEGAQLN
jgi:hypothetical protein